MQSQGATSFQSAIRNVPGITIGAAEGGTIGNNININGFSARTDMYIDGMRDRGQYYRDVFALEQIEVLMGPSSMLFGRGSTGGVINQVMKKPGKDKKTELQSSATTNGLTRFTADVNQPVDQDQAARVNMMFQRGKASTRDLTNVMDFGISPSLTLGMGGPTQVNFTVLFQHNYDQVDYGIPPYNGGLFSTATPTGAALDKLQPPRQRFFDTARANITRTATISYPVLTTYNVYRRTGELHGVAERHTEAALQRLSHQTRLTLGVGTDLDLRLLGTDQLLPVSFDHLVPRTGFVGSGLVDEAMMEPTEMGVLSVGVAS